MPQGYSRAGPCSGGRRQSAAISALLRIGILQLVSYYKDDTYLLGYDYDDDADSVVFAGHYGFRVTEHGFSASLVAHADVAELVHWFSGFRAEARTARGELCRKGRKHRCPR